MTPASALSDPVPDVSDAPTPGCGHECSGTEDSHCPECGVALGWARFEPGIAASGFKLLEDEGTGLSTLVPPTRGMAEAAVHIHAEGKGRVPVRFDCVAHTDAARDLSFRLGKRGDFTVLAPGDTFLVTPGEPSTVAVGLAASALAAGTVVKAELRFVSSRPQALPGVRGAWWRHPLVVRRLYVRTRIASPGRLVLDWPGEKTVVLGLTTHQAHVTWHHLTNPGESPVPLRASVPDDCSGWSRVILKDASGRPSTTDWTYLPPGGQLQAVLEVDVERAPRSAFSVPIRFEDRDAPRHCQEAIVSFDQPSRRQLPCILALDLGTQYSKMALMIGGRPLLVALNPRSERSFLYPSWVVLEKDGSFTFGEAAQLRGRPMVSVKDVVRHPDAYPGVARDELLRAFVKHLLAQARLDPEYNKALGDASHEDLVMVLTVPVGVEPYEEQLRDALAPLFHDVMVLDEPTAAACRMHERESSHLVDGPFVVIDVGAGTGDASAVRREIDPAGGSRLVVLARRGCNHAGQRFTEAMARGAGVENAVETVITRAGLDELKARVLRSECFHQCDDLKADVVDNGVGTLGAERLNGLHAGCLKADVTCTREDLHRYLGADVDALCAMLREVADDLGPEAASVRRIYLVGGSSRVVLLVDRLRELALRAFPGLSDFRSFPDEATREDRLAAVVLGAVRAPMLTSISQSRYEFGLLRDSGSGSREVAAIKLGAALTATRVLPVHLPCSPTGVLPEVQIYCKARDGRTWPLVPLRPDLRAIAARQTLPDTIDLKVTFVLDEAGRLSITATWRGEPAGEW